MCPTVFVHLMNTIINNIAALLGVSTGRCPPPSLLTVRNPLFALLCLATGVMGRPAPKPFTPRSGRIKSSFVAEQQVLRGRKMPILPVPAPV